MNELPFLLKLLDDPSPRVREKVTARLRELGPDVWRETAARGLELPPAAEPLLHALLRPDKPALPADWLSWLELPSEAARLEAAWELLSGWQFEARSEVAPPLSPLLDELARGFTGKLLVRRTPSSLARYLADEAGLRGTSPEEYYNPLNSNLVWAAQQRRGLPITLAGLYILVAQRAGIAMWGCNFPGHFLVGGREDGRDVFFDPFNGGYEFSDEEIFALRRAAPDAVSGPASSQEIMARVLRNLAVAFQHDDDRDGARFVFDLLARLEAAPRP